MLLKVVADKGDMLQDLAEFQLAAGRENSGLGVWRYT